MYEAVVGVRKEGGGGGVCRFDGVAFRHIIGILTCLISFTVARNRLLGISQLPLKWQRGTVRAGGFVV